MYNFQCTIFNIERSFSISYGFRASVNSNPPFGFDGTRICFAQFASLGLRIRHGLKGFLCPFWIKKDSYFKKIFYFSEIYISRFSNGELLFGKK
jgi:hypothetical protein